MQVKVDNLFNKKDEKLIENYLVNSNDFVTSFKLFGKKERTIITYKKDSNGEKLRRIHEKIKNYLEYKLNIASSSFAYKRNTNCLDCLNMHKKSLSFIKSDISNYFDSIDIDNLILICICNISKLKIQDYYDVLNNKELIYKYIDKDNFLLLEKIIKVCFVDNKLPIGLVTSPILANVYLYFVDQKISSNKKIIYTRYCDDILISITKNKYQSLLEETFETLKQELLNLKLYINEKKTRNVVLNENNYLKYLGVIIVKNKGKNKFCISTSFIRNTIYEYKENQDDIKNHIEVLAKIRYIYNMSKTSYEKFKKSFKVIIKQNFDDKLIK